MEGVSANVYTKIRGYWRRRGYERLNESTGRRRKTVELGSTPKRRRRIWRIKIKRKLKIFKMGSPKKLFVWLRDAYVKMMLRFANSSMVGAGYGYGGSSVAAFGKRPLKEYDEKMIIEIYKSLVMAQDQLVSREAPRFGSSVSTLPAIVES